jgi:hypothetical protein
MATNDRTDTEHVPTPIEPLVSHCNAETMTAVQTAFAGADPEMFEEGYENDFSRQIVALVNQCGTQAVSAIQQCVAAPDVNPDVVAEALRWLGHIEDAATSDARRLVLESCLSHPSTSVRYAAILGLGYLEDRRSLPALRRAVDGEKSRALVSDLRHLIAHWEK